MANLPVNVVSNGYFLKFWFDSNQTLLSGPLNRFIFVKINDWNYTKDVPSYCFCFSFFEQNGKKTIYVSQNNGDFFLTSIKIK